MRLIRHADGKYCIRVVYGDLCMNGATGAGGAIIPTIIPVAMSWRFAHRSMSVAMMACRCWWNGIVLVHHGA